MRPGQQQQGERDEVGNHAGEDEQQSGDNRAGAVGERRDLEGAVGKAGREPRDHREPRLLDEGHAGASREHHPREHPPAQRLAEPHQHHRFEEGESQ